MAHTAAREDADLAHLGPPAPAQQAAATATAAAAVSATLATILVLHALLR